ncbi:hypothetical protein LPTSP4_31870 [Leptospira ryugenii]|uniref:Uncharacterized protein n=1 Tax=Leptospira ryugenii TaxID=1917863 RepID=A0A2P2E438_9LEPT|nr:hypothetical protein [Leptospira ryugenii]GBF51649.1 hypothetical protein LPTSP4_31870 [Leptospira ryugenii]
MIKWILVFLSLQVSLFAEKVIYTHGMNLVESNEACQDQRVGVPNCNVWKGITPVGDYVLVGYDGRRDPLLAEPTSGTVRLLQMLNKYCRKDRGQSCRLVSESLGGFTAAATISKYNQSGIYNILYATQLVSAEGGSEVASLGDKAIEILRLVFGITSGPLDQLADSRDAIQALVVTKARSSFDHNRNNGTIFYHLSATKSIFIAEPFLPGKDDSLVAMHSSCGYRQAGAFSRCMGEKVKSCDLCFWERAVNVTPWEGHRMHPLIPNTGLAIGHMQGHDDVRYQEPIR